MNNTYRIMVTSPLIRPGLTIETEVSEKYLAAAISKLMEKIREINASAAENAK